MSRRPQQRIAFFVMAVALVTAGGGIAWWRSAHIPKRFAAVVPGRLYRAGELTPTQLEYLHRTYGVERVLSLLDPEAPESQAERAAAQRLGVTWENVPLRGNGESTAAQRARVLELLCTPDAPPTLVHCAAGANRTGLAIGLYRLHVQHWPLERVMAELRSFGFDDLPKHENMRAALRAAAAQVAAATTAPSAASQTD
jgi:tyrosine-protein phosphatase SIW14